MAKATPILPQLWPDPWTDDAIGQINAMLDERPYTALAEGWLGWRQWYAAMAEGAW